MIVISSEIKAVWESGGMSWRNLAVRHCSTNPDSFVTNNGRCSTHALHFLLACKLYDDESKLCNCTMECCTFADISHKFLTLQHKLLQCKLQRCVDI